MNSLLFFDDWLLRAREGLDRKQGQPQFVKELVLEGTPDPWIKASSHGMRCLKMFHDQKRGRYIMGAELIGLDGRCTILLDTDDPYNWPLLPLTPGSGPPWERAKNVIVDQHNRPLDCFNFLPLAGTPLAEKGYFMNLFDYAKTHRGGPNNSDKPSAAIAFSQDGIHYDVDDSTNWMSYHSDTSNYPFYNPYTKQYAITCRPEQTDRRVTLITTTDLKTFSQPKVVLQPDADDPVCTEFYGLDVTQYDDVFVGTLWTHNTEPTEKLYYSLEGTVEIQLVYSYNGENWYRASREMFIPCGEPGTPCGGGIWGTAPVRTPDNRLLFVAAGYYCDHGADIHSASGKDMAGLPEDVLYKASRFSSRLYDMRLDGFAYLKTRGRRGRIRTKCLVPQGGEMTANVRTTPTGYMKAEVLDRSTYEPLPNYTLEDSIPITGDELFGKIRWRERENMEELKGRPVILDVHLREGELYAMRFPYHVLLGEHPHEGL